MTEKEAKILLMDYLYDEMDEKQKAEFEKKLTEDPSLKKELDDLKSMRKLIESTPVEEPPHKLMMMVPESDSQAEERKRESSTSSIKKIFSKYPSATTFLAAAASILIILTGAAFTGLTVGQTEQGFYLTFGEQPVRTQAGISEEQVYDMMEQIQEENSILMASMIRQLRQDQQEQLDETVAMLTAYYEEQRQEDLRLISRGLVQLQENTYNRFRQTDEALGDLIYAISYQQTQPNQQ